MKIGVHVNEWIVAEKLSGLFVKTLAKPEI